MNDLGNLRDNLIINLIDALPLAVELNHDTELAWQALKNSENANSTEDCKDSPLRAIHTTEEFVRYLNQQNKSNEQTLDEILLTSSKIFSGIFMNQLASWIKWKTEHDLGLRSSGDVASDNQLTSILDILKWHWLNFYYRALERYGVFVKRSCQVPSWFTRVPFTNKPMSEYQKKRHLYSQTSRSKVPLPCSSKSKDTVNGSHKSRPPYSSRRDLKWGEYSRYLKLLKSAQDFYMGLLSTVIVAAVPQAVAKIIYDALGIKKGLIVNSRSGIRGNDMADKIPGLLNRILRQDSTEKPSLSLCLQISDDIGLSERLRWVLFNRDFTSEGSIILILQFLISALGDLARYKSFNDVVCTDASHSNVRQETSMKISDPLLSGQVLRSPLCQMRKSKKVKIKFDYTAKYYMLAHRLNPSDGNTLLKLGKLAQSCGDEFSAVYFTLKACLVSGYGGVLGNRSSSGVLGAYKNLNFLLHRLKSRQSSVDRNGAFLWKRSTEPVIRYGQYEQNEVLGDLNIILNDFLLEYAQVLSYNRQDESVLSVEPKKGIVGATATQKDFFYSYKRTGFSANRTAPLYRLKQEVENESIPLAILVRIVVLTICGLESERNLSTRLLGPERVDDSTRMKRILQLDLKVLQVVTQILESCISSSTVQNPRLATASTCQFSRMKLILPSLRLFLAWWVPYLSLYSVSLAQSFDVTKACGRLCEVLVIITQKLQIHDFAGFDSPSPSSSPPKQFCFRFDYTVPMLITVDRTRYKQLNPAVETSFKAEIFPMIEEFESLGLGIFPSNGQLSDIPVDFNTETPKRSCLPGYDKVSADRIQFVLASCIKLAQFAGINYDQMGKDGLKLPIRFRDGYFYML
ncbi:hypothetical protein NADFUDRAFT_67539 [Nadsonia fulvescens var. elongata DSM 6958]|uniref:Uncharacterized protein n=1 Tax=Nadsonia fulvescens var. elongata DSM 6958 TaxID=857566 RepID=A0A1E3PDI4_9ASCO|nr:hypothetical protein NADFUDRAFT_67539 [Nadsonia fulvescens var. elongata DSM 6958]